MPQKWMNHEYQGGDCVTFSVTSTVEPIGKHEKMNQNLNRVQQWHPLFL